MTEIRERPALAPAAAGQKTARSGHEPRWPDRSRLAAVEARIRALPALVDPRECDGLTGRLAAVARGEALLLQGGDCAETFDGATASAVRKKVALLRRMALVLAHGTDRPVIVLGRMAGQFAKPRSSQTESRGEVTLPAYFGDAVNSREFTPQARTPDPTRLLGMYDASARTLGLLRAGSPGPAAPEAWTAAEAGGPVPVGCPVGGSVGGSAGSPVGGGPVYSSHECLVLDYERAMTRRGPGDALYDTSGHLLWIGERTRDPEGPHVAFAARIANPVAVKLGPAVTPEAALRLAERLNPAGEPGRLTMIARMGAASVTRTLPPVVERVAASGIPVGWVCDPMHGNTFVAPCGHKTRRVEDVLAEIRGFCRVLASLGTPMGGLHLELTGEEVTECVGGSCEIALEDVHRRYESACDPRLNPTQSIDLAFQVAELIGPRTGPAAPAAC